MRLKYSRGAFSYSNKRLRRARKLYAYLIFESVIGDQKATAYACVRARDRGLYSKNTGLTQIGCSLLTHLSKIDRKANRSFYMNRNWLVFNYQINALYKCSGWFKAIREDIYE